MEQDCRKLTCIQLQSLASQGAWRMQRHHARAYQLAAKNEPECLGLLAVHSHLPREEGGWSSIVDIVHITRALPRARSPKIGRGEAN